MGRGRRLRRGEPGLVRGSTPGSTPPASRLFGGLVVVPGFQMTLLDCLRPANPRPSGGICLSWRPPVHLSVPSAALSTLLHLFMSSSASPSCTTSGTLVSPPSAPALILLTASSRTSTSPVTSTTGVYQLKTSSGLQSSGPSACSLFINLLLYPAQPMVHYLVHSVARILQALVLLSAPP